MALTPISTSSQFYEEEILQPLARALDFKVDPETFPWALLGRSIPYHIREAWANVNARIERIWRPPARMGRRLELGIGLEGYRMPPEQLLKTLDEVEFKLYIHSLIPSEAIPYFLQTASESHKDGMPGIFSMLIRDNIGSIVPITSLNIVRDNPPTEPSTDADL